MSRGRGLWALWATLVGIGILSGCGAGDQAGAPDDAPLGERSEAIIYDRDDRLDVYEHPSVLLRGIAKSSVVALIPRRHFRRNDAGESTITTWPLEDAFKVCSEERFSDQPTAAECSGVLIDDDLVLTAGHCFPGATSCEQYAYVFDYFFRSPVALEPMNWGDVYGCRRIVHKFLSSPQDSPRIDFAVVQLERRATGRTPVSIRTTPLVEREPLATIGCVSGLPAKIDSGGRVLSSRAPNNDYFLLDSDTFSGSSGSGVFDAAGQLVGILVRGGADYEASADGGCRVPKVITLGFDGGASLPPADAGTALPSDDAGSLLGLDDGSVLPLETQDAGELPPPPEPLDAAVAQRTTSGGEEATYVARAIESMCAQGVPSQRLCGLAPRCGDGFCSADETLSSCAADCECTLASCGTTVGQSSATAGELVEKSRGHAPEQGCAMRADRAGARAGSWLVLLGSLGVLALRRRNRRLTARR